MVISLPCGEEVQAKVHEFVSCWPWRCQCCLGIGYIRGYAGLFGTGVMSSLYHGSGLILIIVFIVRSLPTGTRSGISALRQIDKSIEESAYDMGANSAKVFMTVTLPLIKDSFFSGLVTAFVREHHGYFRHHPAGDAGLPVNYLPD